MAKPAPRTPKPLVFTFTLGRHTKAGKKSVPAKYTASPCWLYRESEGARTKHLDAIDEEPVTDGDAENVFGAIEVMIDRCDLHRELSTDREIDAGKSPAYTTGFHSAASLDKACDALARGGFTVIRVIDPLAVPPVKLSRADEQARDLVDLSRHVDHASLADVLDATKKGEELGFHAMSAEDIVTRAFAKGDASAFVAGLAALPSSLEPEARDVLVVVLARAAREAKSPKSADAIRAVLAGLPAPADAAVKKLLDV